jgi:hypothetical protein
MRVLAIILASVAAISAMNVSAQAQSRKWCGTRCLEGRIADLQAQIAQLNASTVKSGQSVTINAPGGCLSWGGPSPGSVFWMPPPCQSSYWVIQTH